MSERPYIRNIPCLGEYGVCPSALLLGYFGGSPTGGRRHCQWARGPALQKAERGAMYCSTAQFFNRVTGKFTRLPPCDVQHFSSVLSTGGKQSCNMISPMRPGSTFDLVCIGSQDLCPSYCDKHVERGWKP